MVVFAQNIEQQRDEPLNGEGLGENTTKVTKDTKVEERCEM